jgi:VWFA-related protein
VQTRRGGLVYTLAAHDFRLTDNTVEQKLLLDEDSGSEPLALVVVVETGGAGARQLDKIRKLATMIQMVAGGVEHATAVVNFDSAPQLLQPFTSHDEAIQAALAKLSAGDAGSATLDALGFAVNLLRGRPPDERRAILLISETIDHGSQTRLSDAVRAINDTNTAIYSLAFSTSRSEMNHEAPQILGQISLYGIPVSPPAAPGPGGGCMSRPPESDDDPDVDSSTDGFKQTWDCLSLLAPPLRVAKMTAMLARNGLRQNVPATVAQITGGESFRFASIKDMQHDLSTIANHIPNRYVLSFQPQSPTPGIHAIQLTLRDHHDLVVTARRSYWAPNSAPAAQR